MSSYLSQAGVDVAQTRTAYQELAALNQRYGALAADATLAAGGALPPPFGTAVDVVSLGRSIWNLDFGGALIDVVGFVPLIGDAAKGGRIANRLNDLRRTLDVAATGVNRALRSTQEAAARYWDDIARQNRAAYDEAIAACTTKACRDAKAGLKGPQYANTPTDGPNGQWVGERGDSVWQPANGGAPVTYRNGFPNYSPHAATSVEIPMRGNRTTDFTDATNASEEFLRGRYGDDWRDAWRDDYTWHHVEDGVTMQLVPRNIHATGNGASTPHMGGASMYGDGSNAAGF